MFFIQCKTNLVQITVLLIGCFIPRKVRVYDGVDDHDDDDDVEGVKQPVVDHLVVGRLGDHLDYGGLNSGHYHHDRDGNHDSILRNAFNCSSMSVKECLLENWTV